MIVLKVENIKDFMAQLVTGEMFDKFHVAECEVTTFVTIRIDGRRNDGWFDTDGSRWIRAGRFYGNSFVQ